ncbi:MAG: MerR family transcriptional regulator [Rhodobiaceae bacterium]|nr:MerR family transcriptional regulator [Rhodobiaceae bacterium]MCC0011946.1 MerR family transcriptional regulator [Rhodobiaceae bacterium]MCC0050399.1 MerR family transcriptional regulator [Rhodobiaceae bacterium]MCC0061138.1 MerR family transcriptional regulator [Rhodobiaceae bacterium]
MRLDGILALEDRIYQIGEVAELFGLTTRAIRFYEEEGLVKPIRQGRGRRKYGRSEIERIDMIVSCRQVGISMDVISALIGIRDKSDERTFHAALVKALSDRREQIEQEVVTLNQQRRLIGEWMDRDNDGSVSNDDDGAGSMGSGGNGEPSIRLVGRSAESRSASHIAAIDMDVAFQM